MRHQTVAALGEAGFTRTTGATAPGCKLWKPIRRLLAAAGLLLVALAGDAAAQVNLPFGPSNYEHDFQLFAPFDLDLDNMADDQWSGYFFEYNKLLWSYSGERVTVGNPNVTDTIRWFNGLVTETLTTPGQFAEIIYRVNPQDIIDSDNPVLPPNGVVPPPHAINNTLHNVPPKAGFAWGDRYEIGYRDYRHGWLIGILDGPQLNQSEFHGFARGPNGELPPFIDPDYTGSNDVSGPGRELITADPGLRAFGFGSVPILFDAPEGFFLGFRDYLNRLADAFIGTQGGPMLYVGNYGAVNEAGVDDDTIPFFRSADDLNGNGIEGSDIIIVVGPDGVPRLGIIRDFGDLHKFNVYFNNVLIRNRSQTAGVELMWTHQLSNRHHMAKHQNNHLGLMWGARFLRFYDQFRVDGDGSILGASFWDTSFTNQIVGPQIGFQWANQRQRWRLYGEGRMMFGFNVADWAQNGLIGEELIPGALNRPLYARPTAFANGLRELHFSPVAELRAQASYHVTSAAAIKFGYTGAVLGNVKRAATSVHYRLPDMGYVDNGTQTLLVNGFDFGVEFVY